MSPENTEFCFFFSIFMIFNFFSLPYCTGKIIIQLYGFGILFWDFFDYELNSFKKYRCGYQPPRWPSMIFTSWCIKLCVVPSSILLEWVCVTNSIQQIWWYVTYEEIIKNYSFCLSFTLGKARNYVVRTLKQLRRGPGGKE